MADFAETRQEGSEGQGSSPEILATSEKCVLGT